VSALVSAYNEWFERKVKGSLAAAERGEIVADDILILNVVHGARRP